MYRSEIKTNPHFRRVNISNMTIGNTVLHIQIYGSELSLNLSFIYCEFNRVAYWSKCKTLNLVGSIFQIYQLEIPVTIYIFTFQNSAESQFQILVLVFNRVVIWNKGKTLIFVGSKFQILQLEIPVSIYNFTFSEFCMNLSFKYQFCEFAVCFLSHWILSWENKFTFQNWVWIWVSYTGSVKLIV